MAKESLRQRFLELEVGESMVVSMAEYGYTTIRTYSSDLGFAAQRKFTTHRNKETRSYTVTRTE